MEHTVRLMSTVGPGLEKLYAVLSMAQKGPKIFARYARMRAVEDMVFARYARVLLCL